MRVVGAVCLFWSLSVPHCFAQETKDISKGRREFVQYCAVCHGKDARGDGPAVRQLRIDPADLTAISKGNGGVFPFWDIYQFIDGRNEGTTVSLDERPMPLWGHEFRKEMRADETDVEAKVKQRILNIVYYLETIQK